MKKYCTLDIKAGWADILLRLQSEKIVLLNHTENDFLLAWGSTDECIAKHGAYSAQKLQLFLNKNKKNYIFGYLSYDIKNDETRHLSTKKVSGKNNDFHFLVPEHVLICKSGQLSYFGAYTKSKISQYLDNQLHSPVIQKNETRIKLLENVPEKIYLKKIDQIKENIQQGIIYEMNYCVDFTGKFDTFNPVPTYIKLCNNTQAPFSGYFQSNENVILSGSPERFLKKKNIKVLSQPIKGTAKRGRNREDDLKIINQLKADPKEASENVMIVDLVRNDLSKIAKKNSVQVDELCGVYSFKTVHQLISTISCQLKENITFTEILQALFPMGSMTGAPKISAIKNINDFESFNRGIYSGAMGYIDPNGNFDFNVIIRTIIADLKEKSVLSGVGGAITIQSVPENEYEECLLKLKALEKSLC